MDGKTKTPVELAIAHVLFIDIVGYSKLKTTEQNAAIATLNELVQQCEPFQVADRAGRLLKIPTGDGMALVFYSSAEEPVQCAVALASALKEHPNLQVRMGVHSGSVSGVADVTGRANVAGAGINIAQRVMDCADGGHILLSKHAADDLAEYEHWRPLLHDVGSCQVKHGLNVPVVNLWTDDVGNPHLPSRLRAQKQRAATRRWLLLGGGAALLAIVTAIFMLQRGGKPGALTTDRSVAVLPFENLSANQENAVFAGGVHREILLNLAKVKDLKVISRTSVMQYKPGETRNLRQIARDLGVSHVVEGSVQWEKDTVRITAQLIDASTDAHIWADAYDRQLADVFAIQSDIAQRIAVQLGAHLSPNERSLLTSAPTNNVEAFELFVRARILMETDPDNFAYADNFTKAVDLLETAVRLDPRFALAYCALAEANTHLYRDSRLKSCAPAEAALKEARRTAPDAGEVHFAQALIHYYCEHDFDQALATLELAARSLPNNAEIFTLRGLLERRLGRWEESLRHFERAIELNPKDSVAYGHAAGGAASLQRMNETYQILDAAIAAFPADDGFRAWKGLMRLWGDGDIKAARRQLESLRTMDDMGSLQLAFEVPFAERNYAWAKQALTNFADKRIHKVDWVQFEARLAVAINRAEESRESWTVLLAETAEQIVKNPKLSQPELKATALLNAALGNKEEAIRVAKRGVELFPVSQDPIDGTEILEALALVYTWTGEKDLAFETLFTLARMPRGVYDGELRVNPDWDNLRNDPRFNELVAEAAKPPK